MTTEEQVRLSHAEENAKALNRSLLALATVLGSAFLWAAALSELASQPVTHTGTQPITRAGY
jgi:Sec-independent protein secretion pathway component TatC